jgi:neutral ceramidase
MGQLKLGTSKRNITPPVGAWQAGYAGRDHGAEGVRDELYARALYLHDGETQAAIVCRDLCDVEANEMDLLAAKVKEMVGLEREQLFIANTHTHSGPQTHYREDSRNRDYVENTCDAVAGAISEAREALRPVSLSCAQRPVQCGTNRRERKPDGEIVLGVNPEGPTDRVTDVLCFSDAESGQPVATLFRHAVHGVVMGPDNYLISGDCPGAAEAFVEHNLPGIAGFLSGCCGNINAHPRLDFKYVDLLGRRLGSAVVQGTTEADEARDEIKLVCLRHELELPVEPVPPPEQTEQALQEAQDQLERVKRGEAEQELSLWRAERAERQARERHELAAAGETQVGLPTSVQVIALGDIALIGYPAEVFFEIGEAVRDRSPFPVTLTVTHVNGSIGYVPIASAYEEGGYEINTRAHYKGLGITPKAEQALADESVRALEEAWQAVEGG